MIQSMQNPKIQLVRKLLSHRKDRKKHNLFVLEGVRLIEEAVQTGTQPEMLLYSNQLSARGMGLVEAAADAGVVVEEVDSRLMAEISDTETPQGLVATFSMRSEPIPEHLDFVLILDNVRDPGNLGTILRTSAAAKVQLVLLTPGTADPFSPKVLRAGMGAHFHLPIYQMSWQEIIKILKMDGKLLSILAAGISEGVSCWEKDLTQPTALIIGSEAHGASSEAYQYSDGVIHIPMQGKIESLNASIATGILLFEMIRQRKT